MKYVHAITYAAMIAIIVVQAFMIMLLASEGKRQKHMLQRDEQKWNEDVAAIRRFIESKETP